jgi:hypothetical protein
MESATTRAQEPLEGVATLAPGLSPSPGDRLACGHVVQRARTGQKACSSRCRWAAWKKARTDRERALAELVREARDFARKVTETLDPR